MRNNLKHYTIAGIIFVILLGALSHYFYQWSNKNVVVSLFSPIDESTWEHMKLLFFPMLIYALFMTAKIKSDYPCIVSALLAGSLAGTFLIPILFYSYTGILGFHIAFLDISTFLISVLAAFKIAYRLAQSCSFQKYEPLLTLLTIVVIILFFIFTFFKPDINLFTDPTVDTKNG